jgi:hypothetical protein
VFYGCSSLTSIACEAISPPQLGTPGNLPAIAAVYVPAESVEDYKNATNWCIYADIIQPIPNEE